MVTRSGSANRFALFADGEALGFVKSVSGGNIKGEVATHNMGPDNFAKKELVAIKYADITVETGMGMRSGWYDWIRQSFDNSHIAKSGEIVAADFDHRAERAIIYYDTLITECTFPALDASSEDPAYMMVRLQPERLRHEQRGGERLNANVGIKTKRWLSSNFRLELGDLPCERVAKSIRSPSSRLWSTTQAGDAPSRTSALQGPRSPISRSGSRPPTPVRGRTGFKAS